MRSIADAVIVAWGWRRNLIAFAAGAASVLALAPFDLFPVMWLTVPVLVWLLDGAVAPDHTPLLGRLLPAAAVGWWFGFGYFLAGLWWIGAAFLVDADEFAWLMPFAVAALPAGLALFWAFGAVLARLLWSEGWPRLFALAFAMTLAEFLRGTVLTGFPWNAVGYTLMPRPVLMQSASLIGLWGVTLLAFLVFAAPCLLIGGGARDRRGRLTAFAVIAALFFTHFAYGALRLRGADGATVEDVRLRLVQPAIDQRLKWQAGREDEIFKTYLDLSNVATSPERIGAVSATHLIWPESAFPFLLTERPDALAAIADLLEPGTSLITGAARAEPGQADGSRGPVYNSVYVIDDSGEIRDAYDKVHLVPFGEYLPFQATLEGLGLRQLTRLPGGFAAGASRRVLSAGKAPAFAPLVCYEVIFPGAAVPQGERPGWLLNVTNDAWYGDTPGPRQHLRQAVVRAVEEGLPLVRAANSGISAVADPYGRITARLDLGRAGVVDADLPAAVPPTFFGRNGTLTLLVLMVLTGAVAVYGRFSTGR